MVYNHINQYRLLVYSKKEGTQMKKTISLLLALVLCHLCALAEATIKNKQRKSLLNWMVSGDEVGLLHSEQCIRFTSLNLRMETVELRYFIIR